MKGLMQDYPLVVNSTGLRGEVPRRTGNYNMHRRRWCTQIHLRRHAQAVSTVFACFAQDGRQVTVIVRFATLQLSILQTKAICRREGSIVATLAWNTYRHMECWCEILVSFCSSPSSTLDIPCLGSVIAGNVDCTAHPAAEKTQDFAGRI